VWFDKERFAGNVPRRRNILLGVLALPLEFYKMSGKLVREVAAQSRMSDARIDIRFYEIWGGHDRLLSVRVDR
jgi:hypothetical protein